MLSFLPDFATSTVFFFFFSEVMQTFVQALKKVSCLEVVASLSLMLCRSKNAKKKIRAYIFIDMLQHGLQQ